MDKHIILIGMPGCGKTTIGGKLSKLLGMDFVDTDEYIEEMTGKSIKEIFKEEGEEKFRDYESQALLEVLEKAPAVIATGGGITNRYSNIDAMKEKGVVVFIDRKVEDILSTLDAGSRPLLSEDTDRIYELYRQRYERYRIAGDIRVENDKGLKIVVQNIIDAIEGGE